MRSGGGLRSRGWSGRVGDGFEVIDLGGGDIDEAGLISVEVETGDGADDLAALVKDGESVAGKWRTPRVERRRRAGACDQQVSGLKKARLCRVAPGENYACSAGFFFSGRRREGRDLTRNFRQANTDHRCGVKW